MTTSDQAALQAAIKFLTGGSAYELPFSEDFALRLARISASSGFLSQGAFLEAVKNNPLSTLLRWLALESTDSDSGGGGGGGGGGDTDNTFGGAIQNLVFMVASLDDTDTKVSFPSLTTVLSDLQLTDCPAVTSISFPSLVTFLTGGLLFSGMPSLTDVSMPVLTSIAANLEIDSDSGENSSLESLSFPSLVSVQGSVFCGANPRLTSVSFPNWVPTDGGIRIVFSECALSVASMEHIIHRCFLAGLTFTQILLDGGTNAGLSSLSAQAQAEAAAISAPLITNP